MGIFERLRAGVESASAAETELLAAELARALRPEQVVALSGDLGAGKTTFVRGLARGLGVSDEITSPTFAIFNLHPGTRGLLVHMDAYRLESAADLDALMLEEFLHSPWFLALEWPERIEAWLPPETHWLRFEITPARRHRITLVRR